MSKLSALSGCMVEAVQSCAMLACFLLLVYQCFVGYAHLIGRLGAPASLWCSLGSWYVIGVGAALFWPLYYRKAMEKDDWAEVGRWGGMHAFFGPLAVLTMFPL